MHWLRKKENEQGDHQKMIDDIKNTVFALMIISLFYLLYLSGKQHDTIMTQRESLINSAMENIQLKSQNYSLSRQYNLCMLQTKGKIPNDIKKKKPKPKPKKEKKETITI